ncbi:MAG: hypothetical protein ACE5KZ_13690 [Candidatus Scalinduaceae bacterium]
MATLTAQILIGSPHPNHGTKSTQDIHVHIEQNQVEVARNV